MHIPSINHNMSNKLEMDISLHVSIAWQMYKSNSVICSVSSDNISCSTALLSGKNLHKHSSCFTQHHTGLSCLDVTYAVVLPPFKTTQSVWFGVSPP